MRTSADLRSLLPMASLLAISLFLAFFPSVILAQTGSEQDKKLELPIRLTDEEKTRLHEIGKFHEVTAAPAAPIRKCAEWEPVTGVLIRYNYGFGIPYSLIREFAEDITVHVLCTSSQQSSCATALSNNGVDMNHVEFINCATNSIWTRDYGPQVVFANGLWGMVDHIYNRPRPDDDVVPVALGNEWGAPVYGTSLVHTGGNFMSDGHGTGFSTDLVWDENPSKSHSAIAQQMEDFLGIMNYVVIPDISSVGIHHIDCWAKLLNEETILVKEVSPSHSDYNELEENVAYLQTLTNCYGRPYNIVRVYCGSISGGDVASYTNSLILNNKVFVPIFGISSDAAALATYEAAMPGYEVLGFEGSWYDDDAIHCRGMEIHDRYMLIVDTNPLQDKESNDGDYYLTALIDDRSEAGLVTDSLIVYWRLEGAPEYNAIVMEATGNPDSYYASIPLQADRVNIEYYVFAKDKTGRRESRPMVAPAAWYTFNTGGSPMPPVCQVQPENLDFGSVAIGEYKDASFTITNVGGGTLSGIVSELCETYEIVSGSGVYNLSAGQSFTVAVRFQPNLVGTHTCMIETGEDLCSDVFCTAEAYGVPPVAAFIGSPTSGDLPLTVEFTDLSTGDISSWSWDFGVGSGTSTVQNPSYSYASAGTYTVSLTVANAYGSSTETKTDYVTVSEPGSGYADLPYAMGFESGNLDQYWATQTSGDGRVRVLSSYSPHSGSFLLCMDDATLGGYSQTEAWLHLNLAGKSQVDMEFWWKEFGDENHSQDGVYFSDDGGSSFTKVFSLNGTKYSNQTWTQFILDVDELAASAGLSLTATFVIKFQQYDNSPITTDGFGFDDISISESVPQPPVAAFSGTPRSGTAPLSVQFTDASAEGPTAWSWDFGDGGTSTEQNPDHTYTTEGTYTVTLTVTNASGSDNETKVDYITVTEPGSGTWTVITYDDFEGGMGNYTDGGGDCFLYTSGTYAHQGSNAADIQDNSGTASSFYHTVGHNVSGYTELEVEFWFYAVSMDNSKEDFWVQYYDGSTWHTIASYARNIDFDNGIFYSRVVTISSSQYNFPTNARLRFMCDASANRDDVYIDEIEFRGLSDGGSSGDACIVADRMPPTPDRSYLSQNYPNPFNPVTTISFNLVKSSHVKLEVFNVAGERVATLVNESRNAGLHYVDFDASSLSSGIYIYRLIAGEVMESKKMLLVK